MPLSELYSMSRKRTESTHHKNINCSTDLSFIPENDLVELVWENGQIVMQEQSSRPRESSNSDTVPSYDLPSHTTKSKTTGRIEATDSLSNNGFAGEMRLSEDEEMVPWLNYHIDDQDYCSDFLTGLSGVTENELSTSQSNFASPKTGPTSFSANNGARVEQACVPKTSSFMNFSHFARPAAIIKAATNNIHNIAAVASPTSLPSILSKDKGSVPNNGFNIGMNSKPVDKLRPAEESYTVYRVDASKNACTTVDPVVASSSVCSVSGQDKTSKDRPNDLKRKCHDTEESDCPSDDVEEESAGAKKEGPTRGGSGSKRSRAAEVHNLSERRRRDRINEKMRALQELIPNCNKVDKASMLDEAIEYLKTLQIQVQIMSMGAGMYMPPMMMQRMHSPHISHLSHMGMGFGMGTNGGSSPGYPVMQGGPFPFPGPSSLHGMPGPNLQMFGHPGQGLPMMSAGPPISSTHAYNLKEQMRNIKLQAMQNTDANHQSVNTID